MAMSRSRPRPPRSSRPSASTVRKRLSQKLSSEDAEGVRIELAGDHGTHAVDVDVDGPGGTPGRFRESLAAEDDPWWRRGWRFIRGTDTATAALSGIICALLAVTFNCVKAIKLTRYW